MRSVTPAAAEHNRNMASGEPNWPIPMRAIGAQNLLTMPGGVTIAGYLHKRGGKQLQLFKWPLRYVIIHKGCVYYFKSSTSASSQGAFSLNGYNRVMRAAEETTSNYVFPFKMVHISKNHRTWYFSAASEEERKKWMLALRKEIDFYHEKKETITDLSDTGSDSDSFYGSVERPVDIKYVHNSGEDSWQDEDDDEEDYVKPDVDEDGAPSYPPPPIPKPSTEEEPRRSSISSITTLKPRLPSPSRGISDLDLTSSWKVSNLQNHRIDLSGIPPPIPSLPPAHKLSQQIKTKPPPPPPAVHTMTDSMGKQMPRSRYESSYSSDSNQINPPSFPLPPRRIDSSALLSSKQDHANCQIAEAKHNNPQHLIISNDLKEELNKRLRNASPSKVPSKFPPEKPQNRPNPMSPPLPPTKPSSLSKSIEPDVTATKLSSLCKSIEPSVQAAKHSSLCKSIEHNQPPPIPKMKPKISINNDKLDEILEPSETQTTQTRAHKLPTILPRLRTAKSSDSGFPPILRSPPDGQSFVDKTVESPIRSPRPQKDLYDEKDDSDSDYEKVPLPASVYVDTFESTDVERMFKDVDPRGVLNGLFCIRNSARSGKVLVVWDTLDAKLRNYRIYEKDSKVYLEGEILFRDVATLVEHYYGHPLPGHNTLVLKYAYGCSSNPR